jgi:hypothetical protein
MVLAFTAGVVAHEGFSAKGRTADGAAGAVSASETPYEWPLLRMGEERRHRYTWPSPDAHRVWAAPPAPARAAGRVRSHLNHNGHGRLPPTHHHEHHTRHTCTEPYGENEGNT